MGGIMSMAGRGDRPNRHSTPENSRRSPEHGEVRRAQSEKGLGSRNRGTKTHGIEPLRRGVTVSFMYDIAPGRCTVLQAAA
eukprot:2678808-Rhodomonas_salina.2